MNLEDQFRGFAFFVPVIGVHEANPTEFAQFIWYARIYVSMRENLNSLRNKCLGSVMDSEDYVLRYYKPCINLVIDIE
jgi:hypothetical protein